MWNPFRTARTTPQAAISEPSVPSKRTYAGARFTNATADWILSTTSGDAEVKASLRALRDRSRELERDNDYAVNAFNTITNNVIGLGISFQAQVKTPKKGKLSHDDNDAIETAWSQWCRKEFCHTAGISSFQEIEQLIVRSVIRDGDICVRKVTKAFGKSRVPFAIEILEADYLDDQYHGTASTGNQVIMGVEVDEWRRPVAYHFLKKHPGDITSGWSNPQPARIRVPAEEIIHIAIRQRASQMRGVPWIHTAMTRLKHMGGYEEAELVAARAASCVTGFLESADGDYRSDNDTLSGEPAVQTFEPGMIRKLDPGQKISVPNMSRPGGEVDPFMRLMLRGVAAGLGVSYESLSRDYSQSNFSSSRLALGDERDNYRKLQRWIIGQFHQPVFEAWLDMAVLSGTLRLKKYDTTPEVYQAVKWMPRGWAYIDPLKEVSAYKEAVRNGFMTQTDVVAQSGGDIEEMLDQRSRELKMAKDLDLVFDTDPAMVDTKGMVQSADPEVVDDGTDDSSTPPVN
jgi:lambda family phage portal protein